MAIWKFLSAFALDCVWIFSAEGFAESFPTTIAVTPPADIWTHGFLLLVHKLVERASVKSTSCWFFCDEELSLRNDFDCGASNDVHGYVMDRVAPP